METNTKKRGVIRSLQGLRVLAFAGIFLSHAVDSPSGTWGVSVFIMLSGFCRLCGKELPGSERLYLIQPFPNGYDRQEA